MAGSNTESLQQWKQSIKAGDILFVRWRLCTSMLGSDWTDSGCCNDSELEGVITMCGFLEREGVLIMCD
jgi:hypothetical protein